MILTGKAKEDFIAWKNKNYETEYCCAFTQIPETSKSALIIEWLDNVGITIDRNVYDRKMIIREWITGNEQEWIIDCTYIEIFNNSFNNWYSEAIEKANEIYNEKLCIK